jgi:hypothetical protein
MAFSIKDVIRFFCELPMLIRDADSALVRHHLLSSQLRRPAVFVTGSQVDIGPR